MKITTLSVAAVLIVVLTGQPAGAGCGFLKPLCCDNDCCGSCEPQWLCCQREVKTVKVTRHCYDVECEYVAIPPVTLPCCSLFGNGCCEDDCGECDACTDECGEGCGEDCDRCSPGLFRRLCNRLTACRVRKVHRMKKKEHEVQQCVSEWSVVRMAPPGCGKCCDDDCVAPPSCCAPCGE